MQRRILSTLLFCSALAAPAFAADNQLSPQEQAEGWSLLFNGKDMQQWRNFKSDSLSPLWVIDQDSIKLTGKGGGDILTKKTYTDYDLMLDWKISEVGNSGVLIMADESGQYIYSHAPEIQILDNERHPDNKLATHLSGSLYDMVASPVASQKKAGEWNTARIRLEKFRLQVWQNGTLVTDIQIGSDDWKKLVAASKFADWAGFASNKRGHIGLQDHGDPVWFKNIKIKELN
ncbi:3-keto-disaccharide hydrolase [Rheinheimera sp.]